MPAVALQGPIPDSTPVLGFAERHGPFVLAVAFHAALFVILNDYTISRPRDLLVDPPAIRIDLSDETGAPTPALPDSATGQAPAPPAESDASPSAMAAAEAKPTLAAEVASPTPQPAEEPPIAFPPPAATVAEEKSAESEAPPKDGPAITPEKPQPAEPEASEAKPKLPEDPTGSEPSQAQASAEERRRREMEKLAEIRQQAGTLAEMNHEVAEKGSGRVSERLTDASVKLQAKKWSSTTRGAENGAIRSLDTTNVAQDVAEKVLGRYGIQILYKYIDGTSSDYGFLNQAKTSGGTYYNRVGRGMYQVFSFGSAAISRMMQLENDELRRRQLDPARTRVIEITYGIVSTTRGYDLGVTVLNVAPIEPPAK